MREGRVEVDVNVGAGNHRDWSEKDSLFSEIL